MPAPTLALSIRSDKRLRRCHVVEIFTAASSPETPTAIIA